jgi:hypothetical protein
VEVAKNAVRTSGRFRDMYRRLRRRGQHANEAWVSVARKLLEVLWYMLTRKEAYREVTPAFAHKKEKRRARQRSEAHKTLSTQPDAQKSIQDSVREVRRAVEVLHYAA